MLGIFELAKCKISHYTPGLKKIGTNSNAYIFYTDYSISRTLHRYELTIMQKYVHTMSSDLVVIDAIYGFEKEEYKTTLSKLRIPCA